MYKDLGCANNWSSRVWTLPDGSKRVEKPDTTPSEYKECIALKHKIRTVKKGNCWYQHYCDKCMITYDVDSSD